MTSRRAILATTIVAALLHAALVLATCSEPFWRLNVGTSQDRFGGSVAAKVVFDDVDKHYFVYASRTMLGRVPYRDFVVEYPVLALPFFLLPRVWAEDEQTYRIAFGVEMWLLNAVLVYLVARRVARREGATKLPGRLAWYSLCILAFGSLVVARYDFAPTLLAFAGALWWSSGRNVAGGIAIGLGTLVKVFPGVIAGPAFVAELSRPRRSWLRGTVVFAATVALGGWAWAILGGAKVRESLDYHLGRGLEIGSVYAGFLMLYAKQTGAPFRADYLYASEQITAPGSALATALALPLQAMTLGLVCWRSRRAGPEEALRYAAAAVVAFVVTGKVLSPQYLIWPLPFVAVLEGHTGRVARWLYLGSCLATTAVYPWSYMGLVHFKTLAILILNARNALLVGLLLWLLFGPDPSTRKPAPTGISNRSFWPLWMRSRS